VQRHGAKGQVGKLALLKAGTLQPLQEFLLIRKLANAFHEVLVGSAVSGHHVAQRWNDGKSYTGRTGCAAMDW
jgi:hypothetical protein